MNAVIFNIHNGRVLKKFDTYRGAKGAFTRMCKKSDCEDLECATMERYLKTGAIITNQLVTVYSIFDQKQERPIQIRRGDVGGCCDPSTERYHCM